MTIPLRYLLSQQTTAPEQHGIQPFYFTLSHNRRPADLFRTVQFPDVVPRLTSSFRLLETDFYGLAGEYWANCGA